MADGKTKLQKMNSRLFLLIAIIMFAIVPELMALNVPTLRGRVNDYADLLSDNTRSNIETKLAKLEEADSTQVVLLTISSLEDDVLENFSMRVAESWKIGQAGKDNGVIFTVSKNDRKMRIEVGYGLEGVLTDAIAGRILDRIVVPSFKEEDYDEGIEKGIDAIIAVVTGEYQENVINPIFNIDKLTWWDFIKIIFCFSFFYIGVRSITRDDGDSKKIKIIKGITFSLIMASIVLYPLNNIMELHFGYYFLVAIVLGVFISLLPKKSFLPNSVELKKNEYLDKIIDLSSNNKYDSDYSYDSSSYDSGDSYSGGGGDYGGGGASSSW